MLLYQRQETLIMKKQTKSTSKLPLATKRPASVSGRKVASQSYMPAVLAGSTGVAVVSAAAIGFAGFFAWKNREKILSFVGNYIDLPESWQADESSEYSDSSVGSIASHTSTYTSPTTEQRM
jgi:hypothetical protein